MKKMKRVVSAQKWGFEGRGQGSSGIRNQEDYELTDSTDVVSLMFQFPE
jgi:hypothetical protein